MCFYGNSIRVKSFSSRRVQHWSTLIEVKFGLKDCKIYLNSIKFQITITYIMWIMDNCKRTYKKVCWSTFTLWSGQNLMSIKWSKSEKPILLLKSVISTQYLDKNGENFVNTTYPNVCQNLPTWSALNREPDAYEPILCSQRYHMSG